MSKKITGREIVTRIDKLILRAEGRQVLEALAGLPVVSKEAVPLEQLRGDIARSGFHVQRVMALDPEAKRLFFVDGDDNYLFAEYAGEDRGYSLLRVGFQREIVKEYDPVDLEPEPRADVRTEHEEIEPEGNPGFIPGGTPGVKPDVGADQGSVGEKDRTEPNENEQPDEFDDRLNKVQKMVRRLLRKQPPRPGLVPQSGDPQHPVRWVRPEQAQGGGRAPSGGPAPESEMSGKEFEELTMPLDGEPDSSAILEALPKMSSEQLSELAGEYVFATTGEESTSEMSREELQAAATSMLEEGMAEPSLASPRGQELATEAAKAFVQFTGGKGGTVEDVEGAVAKLFPEIANPKDQEKLQRIVDRFKRSPEDLGTQDRLHTAIDAIRFDHPTLTR